jgi:hypothetical protein
LGAAATLGDLCHHSLLCFSSIFVRKLYRKDQVMSHVTKIAFSALIAALLSGLPNPASAHGRLYPLTRCGPDFGYLCHLHGYFDLVPFHYNVAIYPGCIRTIRVETPYGVERRRTIVCGAPERSMIWW